MSTILAGPHFELPSTELAKWVEAQGLDCWWNVDGDPLLTSLVSFPCPGDELVAELRRLNRPLLVQVDSADARGERIDAKQLNAFVSWLRDAMPAYGLGVPPRTGDRLFYLCWKGSPVGWLLIEDTVTAREENFDAAASRSK